MGHFAWIILSVLPRAFAALQYGDLCDSSPVYSDTWQYDDSCADVYLFCDASRNNTCNYKGCSNSDYIKSWDTNARSLPPRCTGNSFCPDSGSRCTPLVSVGGHCEMQRDDECAGGPYAICLNSTCLIQGVPLGGHCGSDRTVYLSYNADAERFSQTIVRDNCTVGMFCSDTTSVCVPSRPNGSPCLQDRECLSQTCSTDNVCAPGPDVFHTVSKAVWAVLGASVFIFVLLILSGLWLLHRYQRRIEQAKILKFFSDNEVFARRAASWQWPPPEKGSASYLRRPSFSSSTEAATPAQRTSIVFLATPDYEGSAALSYGGLKSKRGSAMAKLREKDASATP